MSYVMVNIGAKNTMKRRIMPDIALNKCGGNNFMSL